MIPSPHRWTFRSYCSEAGDEIRGWYECQTRPVQAEITVVALYLQPLDVQGWIDSDRDYKDLRGKLSGLGELRFVVGKEQHRVLGFRNDDLKEFTMLVAGRKIAKFDFYLRHGPTALKRKAEVDSDRARFSCNADWILLP